MQRVRTYLLHYTLPQLDIWNILLELYNTGEIKYFCLTNNRGFVRFHMIKSLLHVQSMFPKNVKVQIEIRDDCLVKAMLSKQSTFCECGDIAKRTKHKTASNETQQVIDKLVEGQNLIVSLIDKTNDNHNQHIKQITDICMTIAKQSPTIIQNNIQNNNNKISLNVFLNEHCKNAYDITEFARSIDINLDDVMLYKSLGHTEALTRIINKAYNNLDINQRPIHCTDIKRETLYVKDEDKWVNDETKELTEKAICIVANKSLKNMSLWKNANPDYMNTDDKKLEYAIIMRNLLGGLTDHEIDENKKKVIRNLSKSTYLNRDELLKVK
jgi:hypothetical protein